MSLALEDPAGSILSFDQPRETLRTSFGRDDSTGLPLLADAPVLFDLILAYLPLPYSVAEYGCGKKASLILEQLLRLDLPPYALERGMIMEDDMSDAALAESDPGLRPGALTLESPWTQLADLGDARLRALLEANGCRVSPDGEAVETGPFTLTTTPRVHFAVARSHIFACLWLWDDERQRVVRRVLDPTLDPQACFPAGELRGRLSAPQALVFTAPLLGRFRLDPDYLTPAQRQRLAEPAREEPAGEDPAGEEPAAAGDALLDQPYRDHARRVRRLNGARRGSIGDPLRWTYVNNVLFGDAENDARQQLLTGRGEPLRRIARDLFTAREAFGRDVTELRMELTERVGELDLQRAVSQDAEVAERRLQPLAELANTVVYYNSLRHLAELLAGGREVEDALLDGLRDDPALDLFWGLGVSLRSRLEKLAVVSEDDAGRIDARALSDRFIAASVETVRQMNRAGLEVFVDRVGNLHGLLLDAATSRDLRAGRAAVRELRRRSMCHGSHIDTVEDAGKYDGRLGVLSGVEIAHLATDLTTYFDRRLADPPATGTGFVLQVSAFIGEEMTFTGEDVSMPGSAAVAGLARVEQVHAMTNAAGERFGDRLLVLLRALSSEQAAGRLRLHNRLADSDGEALLAACSEPTDFYTPHSYERHIEQGPTLDRDGVPLVLVDAVMGIHQEDFVLTGAHAEPAALEMSLRCRELIRDDDLRGTRLTVGILQELGDDRCHEQPTLAQHFRLHGERNHAGSTALADRRDPGVAAARLARELRLWVERYNRQAETPVAPLVGGVALLPGTNRNVIPGTAALKLGIEGEMPEDHQLALTHHLRTFAAHRLARDVADGGEGILRCDVWPVSFLNTARSVQLSIDLRAGDQAVIERCQEAITRIASELEADFGVRVSSSVEQRVPPRHLDRSGQVLQIERSYGGSHNPHEMELARDLVRGTLLQLAVTREVLSRRDPDLHLFELVRGKIPTAWRQRRDAFTSGALHDTCNVSSAACREPALNPVR